MDDNLGIFRTARQHAPLDGLRRVSTRNTGRLAARLHAMFGARPDEKFGILMYHRVSDHVPGVDVPTWNVTPHQLRIQLAGLLERGFQAWPLSRLVAAHRSSQRVPSHVFAVTFDDGYQNNYSNAYPILRELNIPATIFVATKYLDGDTPFPFDDWSAAGSPRVPAACWRPLSTDECRAILAEGLVDLGAHTHTHERFAGRREQFESDLKQCLDVLRDRFGIAHPAFAFPFGEITPPLIEAARRADVACSFSTRPQRVMIEDDPFQWGRFQVDADDTPEVLASMLTGWYTTAVNARQVVARPIKLFMRLPKRHATRQSLSSCL